MNPGLLIIFSIIAAFGAICIYAEEDRDSVILSRIIGVIAAIAFLVGFCTVAFVPEKTHDTVTVDSEFTEIYTFSDDSAPNNSFIVVSDNTYYYYYKTSSGIKQGKIPTSKTTVNYTNETPLLHTATTTTVRTFHYWWFFGFEDTTTDSSYTLYVPEGAISISITPPKS